MRVETSTARAIAGYSGTIHIDSWRICSFRDVDRGDRQIQFSTIHRVRRCGSSPPGTRIESRVVVPSVSTQTSVAPTALR